MTAEATQARIRIRPLRFGFILKPDDRQALRHVIEINTCLWGGAYNFIIPLFRRTPKRYRKEYLPGPTLKELMAGLVDAFEPDFLVETLPGMAGGLAFPEKRIIGINDLFRRDEQGRGGYGMTLIDVCAALYKETFRFELRHPPSVAVPVSAERRYGLLIAAALELLANPDRSIVKRHWNIPIWAGFLIVTAAQRSHSVPGSTLIRLQLILREKDERAGPAAMDPRLAAAPKPSRLTEIKDQRYC